jgi:hypothetical protein
VSRYVTIGASVLLRLKTADGQSGPPKAENIVWAIGGYITVGASSQLVGTFLVKEYATLGATCGVNGRLIAGKAVTMGAGTHVKIPESALARRRALGEQQTATAEFDKTKITVGATIGAILLLAGAFVLYRRRTDSKTIAANTVRDTKAGSTVAVAELAVVDKPAKPDGTRRRTASNRASGIGLPGGFPEGGVEGHAV